MVVVPRPVLAEMFSLTAPLPLLVDVVFADMVVSSAMMYAL